MDVIRCKIGDRVKLEDSRTGEILYVQWWLGYLNGYEVKVNGKSEMIFADEVKRIL